MRPEEYDLMFAVEDRHWWYVGFRAMLERFWARHVNSMPGYGHRSLCTLDAGCGTGATLDWLSRRANPCGIDLSMQALRHCQKRDQERLAVASATALPFHAESFDAAMSLDVLYHKTIVNKRVPLDEIHRVLRPGGILFLNVAAYQWLYSSHDTATDGDRRFTRVEIVALLTAAGFEVIHATYWNTLLFPAILPVRLWRKVFPPEASDLDVKPGPFSGVTHALCSSVLRLERMLIRGIPLPFGLSVFAVARKPTTTR